MVQVKADGSPAPAETGLQTVEAPARGSLDLHEGISDPKPSGCQRWPENWWLVSSLGELVKGRCKATNLCDYCARLAAVENSELLALDASEGGAAPAVWVVLTTRRATLDMSEFYESHRQLMKALKRRFPDLEWARLLEFTTGYGRRSGGLRRPHWNCLLKGVPPEALDVVLQVIEKVWCPRVDASIRGQYVGAVSEMGGLMRYIALHFQKESQAPPAGFRGHRFTKSRGYLWLDTPTAREETRDALFEKRAVHRAKALGLVGDEAEDHVDREWDLRLRSRWGLYVESPARVSPNDGIASVPWFMLEAAFRWQDERDAVAEAMELEAGTRHPPDAMQRVEDPEPLALL